MKRGLKIFIISLLALLQLESESILAQGVTTNIYGRDIQSLNGKWNAIVDLYDQGRRLGIANNRKPQKKTDIFEYSFENGLRLNVPSDWNSQASELYYYEGTVWYGRHLDISSPEDKRLFLYFGAVSSRCRVYLNGKLIGEHEGGFTPFQIEITKQAKTGDNFLVVEVNNQRRADAIPAMAFDWWNYGGITRDVMLLTTPRVFIEDYFIQLNKYNANQIDVQVKLSDELANTQVKVEIPELKHQSTIVTDAKGIAHASLRVKQVKRWSPDDPKLYKVIVTSGDDRVEEMIGFRNLYRKGTEIYLNDKPIVIRGINFHEEIPQRKGRAFSEADATMLLSEAKALGANMIRLAHYPQNEFIVRLAEQMGFMLWEEIPVWQGIDFSSEETRKKAQKMIVEMVLRDKNRCALSFWGVANETKPSDAQNKFLKSLIDCCKDIDTTRLITAAFDLPTFNKETNTFEMNDPIIDELDVVSVNKYMGWYMAWPLSPQDIKWNVAPNHPLLFSEFGGEALYGQSGDETVAGSWSEDYQEKLYKDNLIMFDNIENLRGVCPWALFDFRSPFRFHPSNQEGWNRKGLVSDQGLRKKAWYVMRDYYKNIDNRKQ